jgi:hypothetical protein
MKCSSFTFVTGLLPVEVRNNKDKNIAACWIALSALLDLPKRMGDLQIEILNQPELLRKLEVINWTPGAVFKFSFQSSPFEAFLNQVTIKFL